MCYFAILYSLLSTIRELTYIRFLFYIFESMKCSHTYRPWQSNAFNSQLTCAKITSNLSFRSGLEFVNPKKIQRPPPSHHHLQKLNKNEHHDNTPRNRRRNRPNSHPPNHLQRAQQHHYRHSHRTPVRSRIHALCGQEPAVCRSRWCFRLGSCEDVEC